jgi:hypothetical protein
MDGKSCPSCRGTGGFSDPIIGVVLGAPVVVQTKPVEVVQVVHAMDVHPMLSVLGAFTKVDDTIKVEHQCLTLTQFIELIETTGDLLGQSVWDTLKTLLSEIECNPNQFDGMVTRVRRLTSNVLVLTIEFETYDQVLDEFDSYQSIGDKTYTFTLRTRVGVTQMNSVFTSGTVKTSKVVGRNVCQICSKVYKTKGGHLKSHRVKCH